MIIDGLTHVTENGLWLDGKLDASAATLVHQMDLASVDKSIVTALHGAIPNEAVRNAVQRFPDRLIGFAAPDLETDPAAELARLKDQGFAGVKLHPRFGRYSPGSESIHQLVEEAVTQKLPVILCSLCGNRNQLDYEPPHEALARWCDQFPQHPFVLAHAGSHRILDAWTLARNRENMYLDISHTLHYFDGSSVEQDLVFVSKRLDRRVLFGSDFPECSIPDAVKRIERLLSPWDEADRARIMGETWQSLLEQ